MTAANRMTVVSLSSPTVPRLRMATTGTLRALLDGGWWPRSTDPVAEVPGLVLAIDKVRGPVTRLLLAAGDWIGHPGRLGVAGRVLRIGYFTSQPTHLLTALGDDGTRFDLLVVPPDTDPGRAEAALCQAVAADNLIHAQDMFSAAGEAGTGVRAAS